MHVGFGPVFQNPDNALSDAKVSRQELRLTEMAEPLGSTPSDRWNITAQTTPCAWT
jgi:hypothetical protein